MKLYFSILVGALGGIAILNAWVDVSGLQTYAQVYRLAVQQQPEELLVWPNLFDQRAWLKARLERGPCPEVLVLGSSTVGAFRQEWFGERHLLNGWMGAPTIEDLEAIAAIAETAQCAPAQVVIGIDHWLLNSNFNDKRWISLAGDFATYQTRRGRPWMAVYALGLLWDTFKERLSFVTTLESLRYLLRSLRSGVPRTAPTLVRATAEAFCQTISSVYYIRSYDGHYTSCPVFASSDERVRATATAYVTANGHQVRQWRQVDGSRLARLAQVVHTLRSQGSKVVLLAPAFHPITYRALMDNDEIRENLRVMDSRLGEIAAHESAVFVNVRDPAILGCSDREFEDSHHAKPTCARKIVERVVQFGAHAKAK